MDCMKSVSKPTRTDDMVIQELAMEAVILRERVASLEADLTAYQELSKTCIHRLEQVMRKEAARVRWRRHACEVDSVRSRRTPEEQP